LKRNNPLYANVQIDEEALATYNDNGDCPTSLLKIATHDESSDRHVNEQKGYAAYAVRESLHYNTSDTAAKMTTTEYTVLEEASGMLIVENKEVLEDQRISAGLQSLLEQAGETNEDKHEQPNNLNSPVIRYPHDEVPASEFNNPNLLMGAFPHLFPYGVGGFEENRCFDLAYHTHAGVLMKRLDVQYRKDPNFMYVLFNIIQRRRVNSGTYIIVDRIRSIVRDHGAFTIDDIREAIRRMNIKSPDA
jgi:hypothetical protein